MDDLQALSKEELIALLTKERAGELETDLGGEGRVSSSHEIHTRCEIISRRRLCFSSPPSSSSAMDIQGEDDAGDAGADEGGKKGRKNKRKSREFDMSR